MKKNLLSVSLLVFGCFTISSISAQIGFDPQISFENEPETVLVPPSPIQSQVIFIGGYDSVQTTATYGNPAGAQIAKQWHDFIGFTPETDPNSPDLGWLSINHEMIFRDSLAGDGGGMTVFKIRRDEDTDSIVVVSQTLSDGRTGEFFNVDFANTVGETGMNCGGIVSEADGRIWTAEEWFRSSNASIYTGYGPPGVLDTMDFTISGSGIPMADGKMIRKYENFNWMVEIDPKEAVAIRKQYNWGRQPFEGGVVMPDDKTVYLGADNTPGIFSKFVATTAGDFTEGKLYAYREDDSKVRLSHRTSLTETESEISAYDPTTGRIYSTESATGGIYVSEITATGIDSVDFYDLSIFGEPTSVDVYNGVVAVSVPNVNEQLPGVVLLADVSAGTPTFQSVTVGALPDMVKFSPNGNYVLVANEGEPNDNYDVDPEGSVSVIDVSGGIGSATVATADFTAFNGQNLPNVRIFGPGATVAQDLEPEYIAIDATSAKAYVSCQENNALAIVDIATATVDTVVGLGFKDYSVQNNWIDASDDDGIIGNFQQWDNVYGMYQPDAIEIVSINGTEYIVSANEGDARDYDGFSEEDRVADLTLDPTAFPNAATLQQDINLGRLKITTTLGDADNDGDYDELYSYGARSFSIWTTSGTLVYDSGNEFGKILAEKFPDNYADNRDDDKGSEPESIDVIEIAGKTFVFIGLERATGVMVYDITDPANAFFVNYYNKNGIDRSPEGLVAIPVTDNPTNQNILVSTNESFGSYGGSISLYNINGLDGEKWIEINNGEMDKMLTYQEEAINAGATMFNRLEWVAYNVADQNVYMTETGRDNPAGKWKDEECRGGVIAQFHYDRATAQGTDPLASDYVDYYGRVLKFDTSNDSVSVALAAGPEFNAEADSNIAEVDYPETQLSNPDGLTFMTVGTKTYMVICEDLNGTSHGRMPAGISNRACEMFLLDTDIANPTIADLVRIAQVPKGAEITGARATPDGKTLFFNSQHPSSSNPFPYNNSLTIALTGWDKVEDDSGIEEIQSEDGFGVYPNPTARFVNLDEVMDVAIYNGQGQLIRVERNTKKLDIIDLKAGTYYIKNQKGQMKKLILQ